MRTPGSIRLAFAPVVLLTLLNAGSATVARGQEARSLLAGQWIRFDTLRTPQTPRRPIAGRYLSADSIALYVDPDGPVARLAVDRRAVRDLEVRTSRSGAASGLLAGSLVGGAFFTGMYIVYCREGGCNGTGAAFLVFVGGPALLGTAIGHAIQRERWTPARLPPTLTP